MKFVDLKASLNRRAEPCYVISGDDRYLCYNALELIEKRFATNFEDMNKIVFEGDKIAVTDIVDSACVFPVGDNYRLVIIKDFKPKDAQNDLKILSKYLQSPMESTIIVFFYTADSDFIKKLDSNVEHVNCDKLDEQMLSKWILMTVMKNNVSIDDATIKLLCMYADFNLAKISSEIEKLSGTVGGGGIIDEKLIREMVVPEKEYEVYELSDKITKKDGTKAFEVLTNILEREKNTVGLITILYNHFRRLLSISLSKENDNTLSALLNVKPYAIKMMRQQSKNFSPKQLKKIVTLLSDLEYDTKSGKFAGDNAIVYAICNILLIG